MFRDLPRYDGRVENDFWGGAVPTHWRVLPGLAVLEENRQKNDGLVESQVLSLSYGRVVVKPIEKQRGLVPESYEGYQILEPGDIVVRPTDLQNDQASIRVGPVRDRGIITSAYIGLRARGSWDSDFAYQYLYVVDSSKRIYGMGSGLRQQLGWADLKRMPCLVPPAEEQAAIVKYLAHANARIDKAITAKRRLIGLLEDQRRAVAEEALACLTDSRERLGFHVDLLTGYPYKSGDFTSNTAGSFTRLLRGANVGVGQINWHDVVTVGADIAHSTAAFAVSEGDLVLGMDRPVIKAGARVSRIDRESSGSLLVQRVARLRPRETLDIDYLELVFSSRAFSRYLEPIFTGISVPHLSPKQIRDFPVTIPPLSQQAEVVRLVGDRVRLVEEAKSRARDEIVLLLEFLTRLVADVVTGQVDVRAVAAGLPDAPEAAIDLPDESIEDLAGAVEGTDA